MQDPQFVNVYYEARVERIAASSDRISRITHRLSVYSFPCSSVGMHNVNMKDLDVVIT